MSLRNRLLLILVVAISLVWLSVATLAFHYMRHEVDELFNHQLQQVATTLGGIDLRRIDNPKELLISQKDQDADDHFAVYLWDKAGKSLFVNLDAPAISFMAQDGFLREVSNAKGDWRVWQFFNEQQQRWIAVGRELNERDELLAGLVLGLFLPWLFSLMLVIWLVWLSINAVIGKLAVLSGQIGSRRIDDLAPVDEGQAPAEIKPLVRELNQLLARLDSAMQNERRFTADASHELRTPLAAIRVQAELAGQCPDNAGRAAALQQVLTSVDRASHTLGQLLQLARLDNLSTMPDVASFDLQALAREVLADVAVVAVQKQIDLELLAEQNTAFTVYGQRDLLRIALRNLLDNAVAHASGRVSVTLEKLEQSIALTIEDDGPGVPPASLPLLGERFYRMDVNRPGTGLGLSIVRQIVQMHGGQLDYANRIGLSVTITLPDCVR